ncbi:hypothetical protein [Nostoc sp. TCL26-01]|uniref:hypothetical protein n=1 Tax=Nostoc sp. TCL26-01 TaxID=2576904 RepID=UPI0015BEA7E5|nr:hypothetical protein [Nostoc sp. TCL26-01]QLE58952.1 hypothetical protein FD725_27700 [Nostoc sp. TCL26-01]
MKFNSALITTFAVAGIIIGVAGNLSSIQPAVAQRISTGEVWQQVYQQLPDFPKENQYINKETGKVADTNTLAGRLIRYHVYVKERAPNYRLDWKLTLADYLNANEIIYENTYPGNDTLRQNPIDGDRTAISRLTRTQRNALVQVLTNLFNPTPTTRTNIRQTPQTGGADLLK